MIESDVLVIGAGPAGMAAATEAAGRGARVTLLDEQRALGGQIYRNVQGADAARLSVLGSDYAKGRTLTEAVARSGVQHVTGAVVWDVAHDGTVTFSKDGAARQARGARLLLATGAVERPVPIPGWTLPGVSTAGAAQILLKSAGLAAENAVIAGSGPLIYLLAVQMIAAGAPPKAIVETQTMRDFWAGLKHLPGALAGFRTLWKGAGFLRDIRRAGVPRVTAATELRVEGQQQAEGLRYVRNGTETFISCDTILLHQGVVPNTQISQSLRLEHRWDGGQFCFCPVLNEWGETSLAGVFVAGDGGGIGGALAAERAGRLGALEAVRQLGLISPSERDKAAGPIRRALRRDLAIRPFLDAIYPPAPEILAPADDVLVCRCEEVTAGDIREFARLGCLGPNQAKAFGRSGMGPCQGRYCGLTVTEILARENRQSHENTGSYRIRSPLKPVSLAELASLTQTTDPERKNND